MNKYTRKTGMAILCLGALLLLVGYAFGWTDSNAVLLAGGTLVVAGAVLHVYFLKKDSKY